MVRDRQYQHVFGFNILEIPHRCVDNFRVGAPGKLQVISQPARARPTRSRLRALRMTSSSGTVSIRPARTSSCCLGDPRGIDRLLRGAFAQTRTEQIREFGAALSGCCNGCSRCDAFGEDCDKPDDIARALPVLGLGASTPPRLRPATSPRDRPDSASRIRPSFGTSCRTGSCSAADPSAMRLAGRRARRRRGAMFTHLATARWIGPCPSCQSSRVCNSTPVDQQ